MKYLVLIEGKGYGCDYTIGCNKEWIELNLSDDIEKAEEDAIDHILKYYGDEERVESIKIVPYNFIIMADLQGYLNEMKFKEEAAAQAINDANEKAEYERLKKKFEGS